MNDLRELLLHNEFLDSNWPWLEKMGVPLETRITPTNKRVFQLGLSRMMKMIPASNKDRKEKIQKVKRSLYRLWVTTGVYDVFFWICAYAYYREQVKYIKELWRHVNPKDASAHWGNTNLIRFDIGFLTCQMASEVWIPDEFEDYHSSELYILRYYFLCLAYTLLHTQHDWHPMPPFLFKPLLDQDEEYSETMREELQAAYAFLANLPYYTDKVLPQYDIVVSEKEDWEDVFDGKISDALEQARSWLSDTQRRQEWMSKAEGIIRDLPLENRHIEAYQKAAMSYYKNESQVPHLAIQAESNDKQHSIELTGRGRFQAPEKRHFTLIGLDESQKIGTRVGFGAVHELVRLEISYIADTLLAAKEQEVINVKGLGFDSILKIVERIKQAGYLATVLIAPGKEISSAWQKDHQFRVNMKYENQKDRYLQIDADTRLKIIEMSGDYAFIFGMETGIWTTVEPVVIEITECDGDPLSVQIIARETLKYQTSIPEAVQVLKFNSSSQQKPKPLNRLLTWLSKWK